MHKIRFLLLLAALIGALITPLPLTAAELEGSAWTLTELGGKAFAAPAGGRGAPTLQFDSAKKSANGFSGVNRYFGGYEKDGDKLKFGALGSTRMAGPPEAMQAESAFHAMLASVSQWQIADGTLALLSEGKVVARFAARPAAEK
jgi:heat shock protein HslJ